VEYGRNILGQKQVVMIVIKPPPLCRVDRSLNL